MALPTFQSIEHKAIREPVDPSRLNIDREKVADLADDIARNGLLQPIGVRGPMPDGTYQLGFGHRRWLAAGSLGWPSIDCKVWDAGVDLHQIRASENHQREPLTPIEEAHELRAFIERGEPLAVAVRRYRKTVTWGTQRLALLDYPPDVQAAVHEGRLKLGVAAALAQIDHDLVRADYVREAERTGCTTSVAELWLQHWKVEGQRMAANSAVVEEIALRRSAFIYFVPCDLCAVAVDFATTVAKRTCPVCTTALDQIVADAVEAARGGAATQATAGPAPAAVP